MSLGPSHYDMMYSPTALHRLIVGRRRLPCIVLMPKLILTLGLYQGTIDSHSACYELRDLKS